MANTFYSVCYRCIHPRRKSKTLYKSELDVDNPVYDEAGVGLLNPHEVQARCGLIVYSIRVPYSGYFLRAKIFAEVNFRNSFIGIHQAQSKLTIVCITDARNRDPCQIVQYYG